MSILGLLSGRKSRKLEEYDPKEHGPLIEPSDLDDSIDVYPVHGPYARVSISEGKSGERYYHVYEPELSSSERKKMDYLKGILIDTVDIDLSKFEKDGKRKYLEEKIMEIFLRYEVDLPPKSREKVIYYLLRDLQGYGVIDPLMRDEKIEDISCDGSDSPVFIYHREYGPLKTNVEYDNEAEVQSAVIKLAQKAGKHISIANPLVDATLEDGSRLQLSFGGEVTTRGSTYTVRKFRSVPYSPVELVQLNTLSPEILAYLWLVVDAGKSVIFAGGTASGKTTTLNATSLFIPPESKIVSIEDTRELNLPHENWIPGLTRGGFGGGAGEIDMYDLLKSAVRQRPDYLLVGEVRGKEAYVLFQAMATGHICLSTLHAESADGTFRRLRNPPMDVSLSLLESLDVITVQANLKVGGERARRFLQVAECTGVDHDAGEILTDDVFMYDPGEDSFEFIGSPRIFKEVSKAWSLSDRKLESEFKKRQKIVEKAVEEKTMDYRDFWRIVVKHGRSSGSP